MLKIERKSQELYIRLRDTRVRLLSQPFGLALAGALALHVLAAVLFRFPEFQPSYAPANHELVVETMPFDGQIIANIAAEPISGIDDLLPKTLFPQAQLAIKPRRTLPLTILAGDLFTSLESGLVSPPLRVNVPPPQTKISISGPLAEYPVEQGAALVMAGASGESGRVRFAVEVNAREGKIHWYEPLDHDKPLLIAEQLLGALTFSIPNQAALISGEIEVVLHD